MTANRREEKINSHPPALIWETLDPLFVPGKKRWLGCLSLLGKVSYRGHIWSWMQCHTDHPIHRNIILCAADRVAQRVGDVTFFYQMKLLHLSPFTGLQSSKQKRVTSLFKFHDKINLVNNIPVKNTACIKFLCTVGMNHWKSWGKQVSHVNAAFRLF